MLSTLMRPLRWAARFRQRCGYNVHSPFAFSFITGVVYERGAYYAYAPLSPLGRGGRLREKDYRLLLRLANFSRAGSAVVWNGNDRAAEAYLRAGRAACRYCFPDDETAGGMLTDDGMEEKAQLFYIDRAERIPQLLPRLLPRLDAESVIVVHGIGHHAGARRAWHKLRDNDAVRVTFDLHDFGIAFTEARLNRCHYVVNYF